MSHEYIKNYNLAIIAPSSALNTEYSALPQGALKQPNRQQTMVIMLKCLGWISLAAGRRLWLRGAMPGGAEREKKSNIVSGIARWKDCLNTWPVFSCFDDYGDALIRSVTFFLGGQITQNRREVNHDVWMLTLRCNTLKIFYCISESEPARSS